MYTPARSRLVRRSSRSTMHTPPFERAAFVSASKAALVAPATLALSISTGAEVAIMKSHHSFSEAKRGVSESRCRSTMHESSTMVVHPRLPCSQIANGSAPE